MLAAIIQGIPMLDSTNQSVALPAALKSQAFSKLAIHALNSVLKTAHNTLSLFGLSALIIVGLLYLKPELSHQIRAFLPFQHQENDVVPQLGKALELPKPEINQPVLAVASNKETAPHSTPVPIKAPEISLIKFENKPKKNSFDDTTLRQQAWVSNWLSKRYRVANDATSMLVATSYSTAKETKLDPLLILAVMAIESGLNPFAESPVGAQGLMQVMSKIHHQRFKSFGGIKEALNPHTNIRVGASILKEYVTRGGSVEAGLKSYVGAAAFETDSGYGSRVLAEYNRLKAVAGGQAVPTTFNTVVNATARPRPEDMKVTDASKEKLALVTM